MSRTFHEIPRSRPATPLLDQAGTPDLLRQFNASELEALADELREELLYIVGQTGGHFGAGLGVIELTIALHRVFEQALLNFARQVRPIAQRCLSDDMYKSFVFFTHLSAARSHLFKMSSVALSGFPSKKRSRACA